MIAGGKGVCNFNYIDWKHSVQTASYTLCVHLSVPLNLKLSKSTRKPYKPCDQIPVIEGDACNWNVVSLVGSRTHSMIINQQMTAYVYSFVKKNKQSELYQCCLLNTGQDHPKIKVFRFKCSTLASKETLRSVPVTAWLTNLDSKPLWLQAELLRVDASSSLGMGEQDKFNKARRILQHNKVWKLLGILES